MDETDRVLHYGDAVYIEDLKAGGLIRSDGEISQSLFVVTYQGALHPLAPRDLQHCSFVVEHAHQYAAKKAFDKKLREHASLTLTPANWKTKLDQWNPIYEDLERSESQVQDEELTNEMEAKRMFGEVVTYGSVIQLRQTLSGALLTQCKRRAAHDILAMEVALQTEGMQQSLWRLIPAESAKRDGEKVRFKEKVWFENFKIRSTYLSTYSTGAQHLESFARARSGAPSQTAHDFKAVFPHADQAFELNASASASSCRLLPAASHSKVGQELGEAAARRLLHGTKAVTLRHKQLDLYLACDAASGTLCWTPTARTWAQLGKVSPSAMWQVMPPALDGGAGPLASPCRVIIQHLCSGKILSLSNDQVAMVECSAEAVPCVWTLGAVRDRNDDGKYLHREETVTATHLCHRRNATACLSAGAKLPEPLAGGTAWEVTVRVGVSQAETDVLEVCMVEQAQVRTVDQVRQCAASVQASLQTLREGVRRHREEEERMPVVSWYALDEQAEGMVAALSASFSANLSHLIRQCAAPSAPSRSLAQARVSAQHLMRELRILPACIALVRLVFEELQVDMEEVRRMPHVRQLCRQCYGLLEKACSGNLENKRAMIPEVPVMHKHIRAEVGAYATLLEVYRGTEELLRSIADSVFEEAVASLAQTRSPRVLSLIIETSHCDGHPIKRNQDRWVKALLVDEPELVQAGRLQANMDRRGSLWEDDFSRTGSGESNPDCDMGAYESAGAPNALFTPFSAVSSEDGGGGPFDIRKMLNSAGDGMMGRRGSLGAGSVGDGEADGLVSGREGQRGAGNRYMLKMLEVFQALVRGRNQYALLVIKEHAEEYGVSYGALVRVLREQRVPGSIARECCKLLVALYVDCDDRTPVDLTSQAHVWSKVRVEPEETEEVDKSTMFTDLKEVLIEKLARVDGRMSGTKAEVAVGMMDITINLLRFGFFHRGTDCYQLQADLAQLKRFAETVLSLLDESSAVDSDTVRPESFDSGLAARPPRADTLQTPRGALSRMATGPRLEGTSQLRLKAMELLLLLLETGWTERVHLFFDRFESELERKFDLTGWQAGIDLLGSHTPRYDNGVAAAKAHAVQPPRWTQRRSSRIIPMPENKLKELAGKPLASWMQPGLGWDKAANTAGLAEEIFGAHPLLPELSVASIEGINATATAHVPRVVGLLLQIARHPHPQLQEMAFRLLVVVFSQQEAFVDAVSAVHFVCHPESARLLEVARADVAKLSRQVRNLDSGPAVSLAESDQAFEDCTSIVERWTATLAGAHARETVFVDAKTFLGNLGVDEVVLSALHLQLKRKSGLPLGLLDVAEDPRVVRLFAALYEFFRWMCLDNPRLQERLLDFKDLLCSHIAVDGLFVERALEAVVRDNLEVLARVGQDWIRMYANDVIGRRRNAMLPQWFDMIRNLLSCKGVQVAEYQLQVTTLFKAHEDHLEPFFYQGGAAEWDRRVQDLQDMDSRLRETEDGDLGGSTAPGHCPYEVHLAMLSLLAESAQGASPGPELYASSLFSLRQVVQLLTLWDTKTSGAKASVSLAVECRVKSAYLRLLLHVYLGTKLVQLRDQIRHHGNGIWDTAPEDDTDACCGPERASLMRMVVSDLARFRSALKLASEHGRRPSFLAEHAAYVFGAVCPVLLSYFNLVGAGFGSCVSRAGWDLAHELYEELQSLQAAELPPDLEPCHSDPSVLTHRELLLHLIHSLRRATKDLHARKTIPLPMPAVPSVKHPEVTLAELLGAGVKAYRECFAESLDVAKGMTGSIGMGMRRLALLLSRDGPVSLADEDPALELPAPFRPRPRELQYGQVLLALSRMCESGAVGEAAIVDGLRIMRLGLYLAEPAKQGLRAEDCDRKWRASLRDEPLEKEQGPPQETLCWLQNKFDALGCTAAALSLVSHGTRPVRLMAIRLLLAQLQGCNRSAQRTIATYFQHAGQRGSVFQAVREMLSGAFARLRDIKRSVKARRSNQAPVFQRKSSIILSVREIGEQARRGLMQDDEDEGWVERADGIGRQSSVLYSLVLLQFMCEGQFTPLQDLVGQAGAPAGGENLLKLMIDLFCNAQLLLSDAIALGNANSYNLLGLCVQLVETISESCQGPHRANLEQLLNSPFLAAVNRLFLSITYDFSPDGSAWALSPEDAPGSTQRLGGDAKAIDVNSLRCWLRTSLLNCVLVLFEGVRGPGVAESVLRFIDVRTLFGQIVNNGALLGLTKEQDDQLHGSLTASGGGEHAAGNQANRGGSDGSNLISRAPSLGFPSMFGFGAPSGRASSGNRPRRLSSITDSLHLSWRRSQGAQRHVSPELKKYLETETFSFYILAMLLHEHCPLPVKAELLKLEEGHPSLTSHLQRHTWHVELLRHDRESHQSSVEKVFFKSNDCMDPILHSRGKRQRIEEVLFNIPRGNPREQAKALLKRFRMVLNVVTWEHFASQNRLLLPLIRNRERLDVIPLRLAFLMTLLLLLFYGIPWDPNAGDVLGGGGFYSSEVIPAGYSKTFYAFANQTSHPGDSQTLGEVMDKVDYSLHFRIALQSRYEHEAEWRSFPWAKGLVWALAAAHVAMSGLTCVLYLVIDVPITWMDLMSEATHRKKQLSDSKAKRGATRRRGEQFLRRMPPLPVQEGAEWRAPFMAAGTWKLLLPILYRALMMCLSVLGMVDSPFFMVACTLDIFRQKQGQLVVQALVLGGPNLVRSFLLGVTVIICCGFYSYAYFSQTVIIDQQLCHSPFQCVMIHILESLNADLGEVFSDRDEPFAYPGTSLFSDVWMSWRTFFVAAAIIFWVFLLQGILQGQIIDAFAQMRNELAEKKNDLESKCIVTSLHRFEFSGYPGEWEQRSGGKLVWNYLMYLHRLMLMEQEEFNGMENFVHSCFELDDVSFLPVGRFLARQNEEIVDVPVQILQEVEHFKRTTQEQLDLLQKQQETVVNAIRWKETLDHLPREMPFRNLLNTGASGRRNSREGADGTFGPFSRTPSHAGSETSDVQQDRTTPA